MAEPAVTYTSADARRILEEHPGLHYGGYGPGVRAPRTTQELMGCRTQICWPESLDLIAWVAGYVTEHPVRGLEDRTSYGFKHDFEKATPRRYVSNGQAIAGMLLAGYRLAADSGYNATFTTPGAGEYTLYRFWAGDDLLYTGISNCLPRRLEEHSGFGSYGEVRKSWWEEATHVTLEHYASRSSVLKAEAAAIRSEHPRYNIQHNVSGSGLASLAT